MKILKKVMLWILPLLVGSYAAAQRDTLTPGCGTKPDRVGHIETVSRLDTDGSICGGENFSFPCTVAGKHVNPWNEVLGYIDYTCIEVGKIPAARFKYVPNFTPVLILPGTSW